MRGHRPASCAGNDNQPRVFVMQIKSDPAEMVKICQQMLDQRDIEVRRANPCGLHLSADHLHRHPAHAREPPPCFPSCCSIPAELGARKAMSGWITSCACWRLAGLHPHRRRVRPAGGVLLRPAQHGAGVPVDREHAAARHRPGPIPGHGPHLHGVQVRVGSAMGRNEPEQNQRLYAEDAFCARLRITHRGLGGPASSGGDTVGLLIICAMEWSGVCACWRVSM